MTKNFKMGWLPDYPDIHDYTRRHKLIKPLLAKIKDNANPSAVNLREWCSLIEDQKGLGSCTSQAGMGLWEYYQKRAFGDYINGSRLFLYKTTRNLMHLVGDTGAYCRTTMGALVLFGVPPEEYWPYTDKKSEFDKEPPAFCYAFAQNYQTVKYFRIDVPGATTVDHLKQIKMFLANGFPQMFGFTVYSSIRDVGRDGKIPYPYNERAIGGHAMDAVGYDDSMEIKNPRGGKATVGAYLVRNSWGEKWGDNGYGWLPYKYVLASLARDFWTIVKNEWVETKNFRV